MDYSIGNELNKSYTEITRLHDMLTAASIPHTYERFLDGWQVIYPRDGDERVMDAIEHFGSYGRDDDLLEIMGLITPEDGTSDSVLGYLSAENVFNRIKTHYNKPVALKEE